MIRRLANPDDPSLTVVEDGHDGPARARTVQFHGGHTRPADLARALQHHWPEAAQKLFTDPSERLVG